MESIEGISSSSTNGLLKNNQNEIGQPQKDTFKSDYVVNNAGENNLAKNNAIKNNLAKNNTDAEDNEMMMPDYLRPRKDGKIPFDRWLISTIPFFSNARGYFTPPFPGKFRKWHFKRGPGSVPFPHLSFNSNGLKYDSSGLDQTEESARGIAYDGHEAPLPSTKQEVTFLMPPTPPSDEEVSGNSSRAVSTDEAGLRVQHQRKIYDVDEARPTNHRNRKSRTRESIILIFLPVLIIILLRIFVFGVYVIPSGSMLNTLQIGDRIVTWKLAGTVTPLRRGDIVVFKDPDHWLSSEITHNLPENNFLVKRLIGLPGDTVACKGAGYPVTINGHPIDEKPYLHPGVNPSNIAFDVKVPPGNTFVLGDNRPISADSRYHLHDKDHGFVPLKDIVGVAVFVYWPISNWRIFHDPAQVYKDVGGIPYVYKNDHS